MAVDILIDQPSQEDILGFGKYTNILAQMIAMTPTMPFTVGIFGDWGSGKTTLLRMIQQRIGSRLKTIWFNAWKYDDKQALSRALLKAIHDDAINSVDIVDDLLEENLERAGDFTGQKLTAKRLSTMFFEVAKLDPSYIRLIEDTTQTLLRQYIGKAGRLVVFLDDVDRCQPDHLFSLLQTAHQHFENMPCVLVFAAVRETLESAIQQHYGSLKMGGREYLEKLVQVSFTIPQPDPTRLRQYLAKQTLPTGETLQDVRPIAEMLLIGSGMNMRNIKRLINQLKLIAELGEIKSAKTMQVAVLTKLLVLRARFPEFFKVVEQHRDAIYRFHQLMAAKDDTGRQQALKALPILESYQANQDLIDFFKLTAQVTCHELNEVTQLLQLAAMAA